MWLLNSTPFSLPCHHHYHLIFYLVLFWRVGEGGFALILHKLHEHIYISIRVVVLGLVTCFSKLTCFFMSLIPVAENVATHENAENRYIPP